MSETTMYPAMDAEDWRYFLAGGVRKHTLQDAVEAGERGRRDLSPYGLAALALYGRDFGFTPQDVDDIRTVLDYEVEYGGPTHQRLRNLAERIAALLPPSSPDTDTRKPR
jgi:hypothetical protein